MMRIAPTSWSRRNDARPVSCDEMGRNGEIRASIQDKKEGVKRPLLSFNVECSNQSRNDVSRVNAKVLQRSWQTSHVKFAIYTCEVCQTDASILPSELQGAFVTASPAP